MSPDVITYTRHMGRWEPNASGRLRKAALELYVEQGFEQTTVAEIAARAGLTARTFFRYFSDKREVLFAGSSDLLEQLVHAVDDAPATASPMDAVAAALDAAAAVLGGNHAYSRRRQTVIAANADLRERELIKMEALAAALADALRRRSVADPDARLAAEAGIAVFRVAFDRWVSERKVSDLSDIMRATLDQLRSITASQ
jgi:AcrR family transcriptional regulator